MTQVLTSCLGSVSRGAGEVALDQDLWMRSESLAGGAGLPGAESSHKK